MYHPYIIYNQLTYFKRSEIPFDTTCNHIHFKKSKSTNKEILIEGLHLITMFRISFGTRETMHLGLTGGLSKKMK